jgi:hypothetical protein
VNVEIHSEYQEAFDHLSGLKVVSTMTTLTTIYDELVDINTYIDDTMFALLELESQTLINSNLTGTDYLSALLAEDGEDLVIQTVLTAEKNNPEWATISEKLRYVQSNQGYWHLFSVLMTDDFNTYDYDEIATLFVDNEEVLISKFSSLQERNQFLSLMANLQFFTSNFVLFNNILADDGVVDLATYQASFTAKLTSDLLAYAESFLSWEFVESHPIITSLKRMFNDYNHYQTSVALFSDSMSFASRVVLSKRYSEWVTNPLWETQVMINSYLLDSLSSYQTGGFSLYHEYFFFNYLSEGITLDDQFDVTDFQTMLSNLESTVNLGLINASQASGYIDGLFLSGNSIIFRLESQNNISGTLFTDIAALNHQYFSDALITILGDL